MAKVVVIGGANVDVKARSSAQFIAATSNPGTVVTSAGGVARNIAHNLALLGIETALISVVGDDAYGHFLLNETAMAGVDIALVKRLAGRTGVYVALLDSKGEMTGAINDMDILAQLTLSDADERALLKTDFVVADCNLETSLLDRLCVDHGNHLLIEPVSVPKIMKLKNLPLKAYAITPNLDQLFALTGEISIKSAIAAVHAMGIAHVIVHRGPDGAVVSDGQSLQSIPAVKGTAVTDVTGAGDAAVAGLVCGLLDKRTLADAARLGQAAAASKLGTTASTATTLNRAKLYQLAGLKRPPDS